MAIFPPRRKNLVRRRRPARAAIGLEPLEARRVLTAGPYTFSLVDGTNLDSAQYSLQVLGYSAASALTLQPSGTAGELAWTAPASSASQYGTVDGSTITGLSVTGSPSTTGIVSGAAVSGPGIPNGTTVTGVSAAVTLTQNVATSGTGSILVVQALNGQITAGQATVTALGSTGVSAGTNNLLGAGVTVSDGTVGTISGILSGNSATLSTNALGTGAQTLYTTSTFNNVVFTAGSPQVTGLSGTTNLNVGGSAVYQTTAATTIASPSNGQTLSTTPITIDVASTAGFNLAGGTILVMTTAGLQTVTYTGATATSFTGCTGNAGVLSTSGGVYAGSLLGNVQAISAGLALSNSATASGAQLLGVSQQQAFTASGSTLTVASTAGLALGMAVTAASGIPANTVISQILSGASGAEIVVSNPVTVTSGTATFTAQVPVALGSGSTSATLGPQALPNTSPNSTSNVIVGQTVAGTGIPSSTTVSAIGAQILVSAAALASTSTTLNIGRNNEVQVTTVTITNGSANVTNVGAPANAVANYLATGQQLTVNAFPVNQGIVAGGTSGTTIEMAGASTLSGTVNISFSLIGYSGSLSAGSAVVTGLGSTSGLAAGYTVSGPGIPAGTTIHTVDSLSQITLTNQVSAGGSGSNVQLTITTPATTTGTVTNGSTSITSITDPHLATKLSLAAGANIVLSSGLQATIDSIAAPTATPATAAAVTVAASATATGTGYASFSLPVTAQTVVGSQWISVTGLGSAESLSVGDQITGPGIPANATILAILPTITISNASSTPGVTSLSFVNTQTGTGSGNQLTGLSSTTGLTVGGPVSGTGIAAGAYITAINSPTAVTLSAAPAAGSQTVTFGPASGLVTSYDIGSGASQFTSFGFDPTVQTGGLNGARIYFFVVPTDWPAFATSPSNPGYPTNPAAFPYAYGATGSFSLSQGNNPPNEPTFRSSYPPFSITEITIDPYDPGPQTGGGVHVDVQTVDGFSFPLSLSLQNAQQQTIGTVGQPVPAGSITRQNILQAYRTQFPTGSYADLVYGSPTAIDGQYAGLLNPGNFLYSGANASSPLNTVWDPVLGELFGAVTTTAASSNGQPLATGLTVNVASTVGFPASGTITITTTNGPQTVPYASKTATSFTLGTLTTQTGSLQAGGQIVYAPDVQLNMRGDDSAYYKGVPQTWNSGGVWYSILEFTGYSDAAMTTAIGNVFRIFSPLTPDPLAPNSQTSSGYQVFANDGVFNDDSANVFVAQTTYNNVSPDKVIKGLQRDIVSALNRGVGLRAPMNPSGSGRTGGDTSVYWGTETNWYPYSITEDTTANPTNVQNQFSLFMHTATVNGEPIFTRPTTGGPTSTVVNASQAGTTVTITTSAAHNLVNGQIATVSGVGTGYDGSWVIATSSPTSTSFTYTALTSGLASQSSGNVEGGAVPSAGGLLMGQAYGFAYDEDPVHGPALPQPAVPSKYDPVPAGINTFVITAGPWSLSTSQPTITGISASAGPIAGGTTVIITGSDFTPESTVQFGTVAAGSVTYNSPLQLTVTSPAQAAGTVNITVTTSAGTSATSSADQFTYFNVPAPTGISPSSGPTTGGTTGVVISGTDLAGATSVIIGGTAATITGNTATTITITTPAGTAGAKNVVVTTPGGSATLTGAFTYIAAPSPTGISPSSGPAAGGTTGVVISGTDLAGATSVTIGGATATITANTATAITITTPAGTDGAQDVVVTTPGGSATLTGAFTYIAAPAPTGISPASGPATGGTTGVVISGTDLAGATSVTIGGAAATITANTSTSITITTPAGTDGAQDVVVTTPGGSATLTGAFTYIAAPAPTGISPASGPTAGGTTGVVISGTDLAGATSVTIGGAAATITANTATTITITTPAGTAGAQNVVVTTPGGSATLTGAFTYIAAPAPTGISPASGPAAGGTTGVVISGTDLAGATNVTIGGAAATITANTSTSITITTPAGTDGAQDVVVTTPGGSATLTGAFTYVAAPLPTGISPAAGPAAGGTTGVVISGTDLAGATSVTIGGAAATITANTATTITITTPAGTDGAQDVVVTTPGGSATLTGAFTYIAAPAPTGISPASGPAAGGTTGVVISGTDLAGATSVTIGGAAATITGNTATAITITTPAGTAGAQNVVVTTPGGSATLTGAFTYIAAPAPTGISPASGPAAGGTTGVVISGTDLAGATSVTIGGATATITANTATAITITTPAGTDGAQDVVVTTPGGSATLTGAFTYIAAPSPTGISPSSGAAAGGTTGVVISGTNLAGATSVTIGGATATITANTATAITITTPAGTVGPKNVVVTTPGGSATLTNAFTYVTIPTITGVSPSSGPTAGGIDVTITGVDFTGATAVSFGSVAATGFTVDSPTQITATVPAQAAGTVDIRVTGPNGTSAVTAADQFTYVSASAPTVVMPISFLTNVSVASRLTWPMPAFADASSAVLTATLAISPTNVGGLVASSAAGVTVTPSGTSAGSLQFTGTVAALNAYFQNTAGLITYTPSATSLASRTLSLSATMSSGLVSRTTAAVLVRSTTPQTPPPAVNPSAVISGRIGQPVVITYGQLVAATGATQTASRSIQFMLAGLTAGKLEVWTGSRWAVVPARVRNLPLLSQGGQIRWTPPRGATGLRQAFAVRASDGSRMSGVSQVFVSLS